MRITRVLSAADFSNLEYSDVMRAALCVERGVVYVSTATARRHPWLVGAFCGLWQADTYWYLANGHDTEHTDTRHHMILITSTSARLREVQQETHNAPVAFNACLVGGQVGLCDVVCVIQGFHIRHCQVDFLHVPQTVTRTPPQNKGRV